MVILCFVRSLSARRREINVGGEFEAGGVGAEMGVHGS